MDTKILTILEELTGTDEVQTNRSLALFDEGLLDSLGTVQLLIELENEFGIQVPVSEFDRETWATPEKIIEQVQRLG